MPFGFKPDVQKLKAKQDVNGLVKALFYNEDSINLQARSALVELGTDDVISALVKSLQTNGKTQNRCRIIRTLGLTHNPSEVAPIVGALKDTDKYVRGMAARALSEVAASKPSIDALRALMNDEEENVKVEAAMALCKLGAPNGPAALAKSIACDWHVLYAIETLHESGNPKVLQTLHSAVKNHPSAFDEGQTGFIEYANMTGALVAEVQCINGEQQMAEFQKIERRILCPACKGEGEILDEEGRERARKTGGFMRPARSVMDVFNRFNPLTDAELDAYLASNLKPLLNMYGKTCPECEGSGYKQQNK